MGGALSGLKDAIGKGTGPNTPLGTFGALGGGALQGLQGGQQKQQQPAQPVNFNVPTMPYVPPPTMAPGYDPNSPNPFYGG